MNYGIQAQCQRKIQGDPITMSRMIRDPIRASTEEWWNSGEYRRRVQASTEKAPGEYWRRVWASTEEGSGQVPEKGSGKYRKSSGRVPESHTHF